VVVGLVKVVKTVVDGEDVVLVDALKAVVVGLVKVVEAVVVDEVWVTVFLVNKIIMNMLLKISFIFIFIFKIKLFSFTSYFYILNSCSFLYSIFQQYLHQYSSKKFKLFNKSIFSTFKYI